MRVVLVNMPWGSTDVPSLALGILKRAVAERIPEAEVEVLYANIDFVDWVHDRLDMAMDDYDFFAQRSFTEGNGDWVFSSALYDDPDWRRREFDERTSGEKADLALCHRLHELAPAFVAELAGRVAASAPDVVGFTSTFQQNVAALAAARQVKRLRPETVTILGGASCDGPQGAALHRNFPFVDFVLRGEGEVAFPRFLTAVAGARDFAAIPGLVWRDGSGASIANAMSARPLAPSEIVAPDYDDYFRRYATSVARLWADPRLVLESSRGCWWGEKHHCGFCGLNGSFMEFRSKPPDRFLDEMLALARRHQVLDVYMVDNILDMGYLTSMLPALAAEGYDFRMFYEVKSNLRRQQVRALADAGVVRVQAGIESLSGRVLGIMDKGVTGCQNVRMMRDAESAGVWVEWNYLYGFPGEDAGDYTSVVEQFPALHHLPPPGIVGRLAIERFSPYFDRPELGFAELRPHPQYSMIYDLPEAELFDLAYLFEAPPRGIGAAVAGRVADAAAEWQAAYPESRLTMCDLGDHIDLVNRRPAFGWTALRVEDPVEMAALRLLDRPHRPAALAGKLAAVDPAVTVDGVADLLARWRGLGLTFADGGQVVLTAADAAGQGRRRVRRRAADPADLVGAP
ncbi:RiPP maturation radical SAM C-methyltransferase [Actinomadura sp. NEAU-AAG7]|uniref:RiPP maturation radical SAM C-methyltransferase n=1 Tax=Actinomadura sp. NEAU-AAG7 TaxID=2839640 RepID=UPI001BE4980F|nr:RiPP maturation radical SAM C-methyltransferase [Actinomadura sp. NEAU-AAG7]MBT2210115.1 RiPP maturation radical SAM C-methyltransferase [Actinomadura sp. NEAU-AAG7]